MDREQLRLSRALEKNDEAIIQYAVKKMKKGSLAARSKAAKELGCVAWECIGGSEASVAAGALPLLCDLLSFNIYSPEVHGHTSCAVDTLANIAATPSCARALLEAGVLEPLIKLLGASARLYHRAPAAGTIHEMLKGAKAEASRDPALQAALREAILEGGGDLGLLKMLQLPSGPHDYHNTVIALSVLD